MSLLIILGALLQLRKTIEETKKSVEEKAAAMGEADSDFAKAKARVEKVADELKALEQEQQVTNIAFLPANSFVLPFSVCLSLLLRM
jgi:predicted nuclease with TOPRIM domain